MLETYSPQRHCESPLRYCDSHPVLGEIQRSLSRSPSKHSFRSLSARQSPEPSFQPATTQSLFPSTTTTTTTTAAAAAASTTTPTVQPHSLFLSRNTHTPTLLRSSRPLARRSVQSPSALRSRASPTSPSRRILTSSSDSGNSTPAHALMPVRKRSSTEAEREQGLTILTPSHSDLDQDNKENSSSQEEPPSAFRAYSRQEKRRSGGGLSTLSFVAPQSPMKRGEVDMLANQHQDDIQSPSAKRRSLHGPPMDFSIFESDRDSLASSVTLNRCQDDNDWLRTASPATPSKFSTIPKRSSSLRKSTVQQRQPRFSQLLDIDSPWFNTTPPNKTGKGLRLSLDNHIDTPPRESPFSAQGHLLSASIHPASQVAHPQSSQASQASQQHQELPSYQARHPLSRTMTQSSSTSSMQDDSPTHEPVHRPLRPRSHDFSKSLPVGASRPSPSPSQASSQPSFATPAHYKSAKPLPAAFMSTGLISKKNRNVDEANAGLPKAHMPDTPCKKQTTVFPPFQEVKLKKSILTRSTRESFVPPASPLAGPHDSLAMSCFGLSRSSAMPFSRSTGIFAPRRSRPSLMRKASFASIDSDERSYPSPSKDLAPESQSTDSDFPPTPTKEAEVTMDRKPSVSPSPRRRPLSMPRFGSATVASAQAPSPPPPHDSFFPSDPVVGLSRPQTRGSSATPAPVPATPTGPRDYFPLFANRASLNLKASTSSNAHAIAIGRDADASLTSRFDKVDLVGTGEFSQVYRVTLPPHASPLRKIYALSAPKPPAATVGSNSNGSNSNSNSNSNNNLKDDCCVFAVKKSRYPYNGPRDRQRKIQEVDILKALRHADHVVDFVDSWEHDNHLYIQTEFCEEGTLDLFLAQVGLKARLDDFRIWKILLELSQGLKHIHDAGYIHLDMKPANVLITFDGVLKIADFGMATKWPANAGIEGEGDREYIGPEVLMGKYDKPADIFALGLIMLEIAGNVELPDNGLSWQKLRSGDMSDVPSLTWSSGGSSLLRDSSGNALDLDRGGQSAGASTDLTMDGSDSQAQANNNHPARNGELRHPPPFMTDSNNPQALDALVKWMISPNPAHRPLAHDLLLTEGVQFVEARRRAGATVYEGNWGPADDVLAEDAEMIDV